VVFKRRRHAALIGKVSCYLSIDGAAIDHDTRTTEFHVCHICLQP
jgi:hypothetical protein